MPTIMVWVVTVEQRQGWLRDGDALGWDIAKARTFDTLDDARRWLADSGLGGTVLIAVD
jgi:hypothetical protein